MTCYMIKLRFDGTNYAGYQRQANANTVGEEVLKALTAFFGSVEALSGCSRTDSGVHANCYCASFRAEKRAEPDRVVRGLNGLLPRDISVFDCCEVPPEFHARYSVKSKEYVYYILNSRIRDPFYEKYALLFPLPLDTEELNRECEAFVGTHDSAPREPPSGIRRERSKARVLKDKATSFHSACGATDFFTTWCVSWSGHVLISRRVKSKKEK